MMTSCTMKHRRRRTPLTSFPNRHPTLRTGNVHTLIKIRAALTSRSSGSTRILTRKATTLPSDPLRITAAGAVLRSKEVSSEGAVAPADVLKATQATPDERRLADGRQTFLGTRDLQRQFSRIPTRYT